MTRPLSVRDVAKLLQNSPHSRSTILVGGQALNIWAVSMGLRSEAIAVSHDIDFFGNRADTLKAGNDWKGSTHIATFDDHSPNAGVVVIEIDREKHGIDFMSSIAGVDSDELRKMAVKAQGRGFEFLVMHPLHVMQSQLENVYGLLHRRDEPNGEYYAGRCALAVQVVRGSIMDLLNAKRTRDALDFVEAMAKLAMSGPGVDSWVRDGVDLLSAIPDHKGWPRKFVNTRLPQIRGHVVSKREKRMANRRTSDRDSGPTA